MQNEGCQHTCPNPDFCFFLYLSFSNHKVMKRIFISFLVLSLAVSPALRGQNQKDIEKNTREAYKMLLKETDKNKDGKISKAEFYAIWKDKKVAEVKYKAWDVNKDGFITEEEYVKVIMDMGKKKKP